MSHDGDNDVDGDDDDDVGPPVDSSRFSTGIPLILHPASRRSVVEFRIAAVLHQPRVPLARRIKIRGEKSAGVAGGKVPRPSCNRENNSRENNSRLITLSRETIWLSESTLSVHVAVEAHSNTVRYARERAILSPGVCNSTSRCRRNISINRADIYRGSVFPSMSSRISLDWLVG